MKISIAEAKRRLPVGAEFTAEVLVPSIAVRGNTGNTTLGATVNVYRRRVTKQKSSMVSVYLDGSRAGREIYLNWKNTVARVEDDGSIIITMTEADPPEDFLRISDIKLPE